MTAPAQAQGRQYETQVIRFGDEGINLAVPPEIVPTGQFVVLTDVVANRDGTVQSAAGSVVLFTAANTHSIRRFENHTNGDTFYVLGIGTDIQYGSIPGGPSAIIDTGFSGDPLTLVAYRIAILSNPYMYVGDSNKNIKIDTNGTASKIGIWRPQAILGQPALVATSAGAGNLIGDYDWRYTFANIIGSTVVAESNPSDENVIPLTLASEQATMPLVASVVGQGTITNIRVWRRGGTLPDAWRLVGTVANASAPFVDNLADIDIASAEIMSLDNDVIGTSVDAAGNTLADINAVALPYLWGALNETLFAAGDPNRPDVVYYSKKGYPESWPAENFLSLDSPQDEVVCGLIYDNKSFAFTQESLYQLIPNIIEGLTWTPYKTPCGRGVVAPLAMCVGPKIWFVAKDGVYEWDGQGESRLISDPLRPLFPYAGVEGYTVSFGGNSYNPVDYGTGIQPNLQMRLTFHNGEVWFHYRDIFGNAQTAVYNDEHKSWRFVAVNTYVLTYSDEPPQSVMLGVDLSGNTAQFTGGDRAGSPVSSVLMTGGHDQGYPRADKVYGDGALWMDVAGGSVTLTVYANSDFTSSVHGQVFTGSGLQKYIINLAGLYARHIAYRLTWDSTDPIQPVLYWIENSYLPLPEEITQRMTDWDDLGHPADKLIKGLLLTADTNGNAIEIQIGYDGDNLTSSFIIGPNTAGKPQTYNIGFAAFRARQVRLVPISTGEWKFYGINKWLFDAEPESLDCHDVYWGDAGYAHDKLIKGMTIEADCEGVARTLNVFDDQGVLQQAVVVGPGISGIPAIYEASWSSFRTRNVRIMECSEDAATNPYEPTAPCEGGIPTITSLSPSERDIDSGDFTLTVNGTNFRPDSVVSFNAIAKATTFVSAIQLTAAILNADMAAVTSYDVIVTNPAPGCGPSAPSPFVVTCAGDVPVITDLDPPNCEEGAATFVLTITGTGFNVDAEVTFDGVSVVVVFNSSTELEATIPDTLVATAGTYEVIVTNPPPGCGPSEPFEFEVTSVAGVLRFASASYIP